MALPIYIPIRFEITVNFLRNRGRREKDLGPNYRHIEVALRTDVSWGNLDVANNVYIMGDDADIMDGDAEAASTDDSLVRNVYHTLVDGLPTSIVARLGTDEITYIMERVRLLLAERAEHLAALRISLGG